MESCGNSRGFGFIYKLVKFKIFLIIGLIDKIQNFISLEKFKLLSVWKNSNFLLLVSPCILACAVKWQCIWLLIYMCTLMQISILDFNLWAFMLLTSRKLIGLVYFIWWNFIKVGGLMQTLDSPSMTVFEYG